MYSISFQSIGVEFQSAGIECWNSIGKEDETCIHPLIWPRTICLFTFPQTNCQEDQLTPGSNPHSKIYSYNKGSCPVNGVMVSYLFTNVIQAHRHFDSSKVH